MPRRTAGAHPWSNAPGELASNWPWRGCRDRSLAGLGWLALDPLKEWPAGKVVGKCQNLLDYLALMPENASYYFHSVFTYSWHSLIDSSQVSHTKCEPRIDSRMAHGRSGRRAGSLAAWTAGCHIALSWIISPFYRDIMEFQTLETTCVQTLSPNEVLPRSQEWASRVTIHYACQVLQSTKTSPYICARYKMRNACTAKYQSAQALST